MAVRESFKKGLVIILLIMYVVTMGLPIFAQSGAEARSASLLSAVRGMDTSFDVDQLSSDDVKVYGVFLSNYFVPGKTNLDNLGDYFSMASAELGLSGRSWLGSLNQLLESEFRQSRVVVGNVSDLIESFKVGDIDLSNPVWLSAIQMSLSTDPQAFLDILTSGGSINRRQVYLDSVGNFWVDEDLFIPAALNPMLFGGKVSVNNKFFMSTFLQPDSGGVNRPYYSLVNHNVPLNILGVISEYDLQKSSSLLNVDAHESEGLGSVSGSGEPILVVGLTGAFDNVTYGDKALDGFIQELASSTKLGMGQINDVQSYISLSELKSSTSLDKVFAKERLLGTDGGSFFNTVDYKFDSTSFMRGGTSLREQVGFESKIRPLTFERNRMVFFTKEIFSVWGLSSGAGDGFLVRDYYNKKNFISSISASEDLYEYLFTYKTFHLKNGLGIGSKPPMVAIYLSYIIDFLDLKVEGGSVTQGKVFGEGLGLPTDMLPSGNTAGSVDWDSVVLVPGTSGVQSSKELSLVEKTEGIVDFAHGFATGSVNVISKFFKSVLTGLVLSMHETLTSTGLIDGVVVSSGVVDSYVPNITMLTSLDLSHIPGVTLVAENINLIVLIFVIVLFVFVGIKVVMGRVLLRDGLLHGFLAIFFLYVFLAVPGVYSNVTDNTVNRILSNKVMPWAMVQDQMALDSGVVVGDSDYLEYLKQVEGLGSSEFRYTDPGVRIKWMSPKKDNVFNLLYNRFDGLSGVKSFQILKGLFASTFGGVEYTDDKTGIYVYRPYMSILTEARDLYDGLEASGVNNRLREVRGNALYYQPDMESYKYKYWVASEGEDRKLELYASEVLSDIEQVASLSVDDTYRYWHLEYEPLDTAIFNTSFNVEEGGIDYGTVSNDSLTYFASLTESPYYYFYNVLRTKYGDDFKDLMLDQSTYLLTNNDVKLLKSQVKGLGGSVRDFADVEGLFTYVVPYLQSSNDRAVGWFNRYGYGISSYDFGDDVSEGSDMWYEARRKQVFRQHWNLYSSWVDHLSDHSYRDPILNTSGQRVLLENAMDPGSYLESGRMMVFSEADMLVKGLRTKDLTDVELRIIKFQKSASKRLMNLSGFQGFDNEVLLGMSAMIITEEFNKAFSTRNTTLYPVSLEMKNIDFTVLLKMSLFKVTGVSPLSTGDNIRDLIISEGFFTGLIIVAVEFMGLWLIPLMLFFVTVLILLLLLLASLDFLKNGLDNFVEKFFIYITPLVGLYVLRVVFAFLISLQLGTSLNYMGDGVSVELGTPFLTVGYILFLMVMYVVILNRLLKQVRLVLVKSSGNVSGFLGEFVESVDKHSVGVLRSTGDTAFSLPKVAASRVTSIGSKLFKTAKSNTGTSGTSGNVTVNVVSGQGVGGVGIDGGVTGGVQNTVRVVGDVKESEDDSKRRKQREQDARGMMGE